MRIIYERVIDAFKKCVQCPCGKKKVYTNNAKTKQISTE